MHERPAGASLSFSMINQLVYYLVHSNPTICKALERPYPSVFLNEFQDTAYS